MKTTKDFKNILTLIAMSFALSATAQVKQFELSRAMEMDQHRSNLTFIHKEAETTQTLVATDDDGLLSIAAINLSLIQRAQEDLRSVARKAQNAGNDGVLAARQHWLDKVAMEPLERSSALLPTIVTSLEKYAAYTALQKARAEQKFRLARTAQEQEKIQKDFNLAFNENNEALTLIQFFKRKAELNEALTAKELSDTLGALLEKYASSHQYDTFINGSDVPVAQSFIQKLYGTRPFMIKDEIVTEMTSSRGLLKLSENVFSNGSIRNNNPEAVHEAQIAELLESSFSN